MSELRRYSHRMNIQLLKSLCETPGIPGREERVRELIEKEIDGLFDEVTTDAMGSLICTIKGSASDNTPKVMVAAHMDEIGFYIRHIDDKGFLWVNPAGGFDTRNLFSRRVLVCTDDHDYVGVMNPGGRPIHIAKDEDKKKVPDVTEFFIDLGFGNDEDTVKSKVKVGDFVVMHEPFIEQEKKVVSKALDNRIACYVAIEAIRKLKDANHKPAGDIVIVFTVQEEVGLRGAVTSANSVNADLGIGLDTTLACDTPGINDTERVTKHGDGVGVMVQDSSMIGDRGLTNDICQIAEDNDIPYQRCILPRGGQDGAAIQRANHGAKTAAIVVGTRYIHTVTESADKGDLQAGVDLLAAWLKSVK